MTGEAVRTTGPATSTDAEPGQQLLQQDPTLEPGQHGPDAEVGTEPEGHVGVGVAGGVEPVGGRARTPTRRGWPRRRA